MRVKQKGLKYDKTNALTAKSNDKNDQQTQVALDCHTIACKR